MKTVLMGAPSEEARQKVFLYTKLVLTAVFWGGTFVAGRMIAPQVGPFSAAFLRFFVTSAFLWVFVWRSGESLPRLTARQFFLLVLLGLSGVFAYNFFFFSGLQSIAASRAALIISSNPAFIALFAAYFFHERLTSVKVLGILLSVGGAAVIISRGHPDIILQGKLGVGELYIFGCVASWVLYSLVGKIAMQKLSPLISVTYACTIGAFCLLFPALWEGLAEHFRHFSMVVWVATFYLGFFGSALGFFWYYEGIKALGPSRAGVFINIVPLSSILLAFFILHEALGRSLIVGALLVISGVYLTNRSPSRPEMARGAIQAAGGTSAEGACSHRFETEKMREP